LDRQREERKTACDFEESKGPTERSTLVDPNQGRGDAFSKNHKTQTRITTPTTRYEGCTFRQIRRGLEGEKEGKIGKFWKIKRKEESGNAKRREAIPRPVESDGEETRVRSRRGLFGGLPQSQKREGDTF